MLDTQRHWIGVGFAVLVLLIIVVANSDVSAQTLTTRSPCGTNWSLAFSGTYAHPDAPTPNRLDASVGQPPTDVPPEGNLARRRLAVQRGSVNALARALTDGCDLKVTQQTKHFTRSYTCATTDWDAQEATCRTADVAMGGERSSWTIGIEAGSIQIAKYLAPVSVPEGGRSDANLWPLRDGTYLAAEPGSKVTIRAYVRK